MIKASDTERQRLERNLHDGAQQRLTALAIWLEMDAESARISSRARPAALRRAQAQVVLAIEELRELAHGIHPQVLTDAGLASAIGQLAARSTVPVILGELPSTRLDDIAEATAYYLVAEALTNAQKHAHATSLHVHATITGRTLRLEIVDDGVGGATEPAQRWPRRPTRPCRGARWHLHPRQPRRSRNPDHRHHPRQEDFWRRRLRRSGARLLVKRWSSLRLRRLRPRRPRRP